MANLVVMEQSRELYNSQNCLVFIKQNWAITLHCCVFRTFRAGFSSVLCQVDYTYCVVSIPHR